MRFVRSLLMSSVLGLAACGTAQSAPSEPIAVSGLPSPARPPARATDDAAAAPICPNVEVPGFSPPTDKRSEDVPRIEEPSPEHPTLAPFYEELARLIRGRRTQPLRIAVYGDSNLTMDFPTGRMRRTLQGLFGDAGHGFVALGQPWSHYQHMDVRHGIKSGYSAYAISTTPIGDGGYGLSGIVVENQWQGAVTWVETAKADAPVGTRADSAEIFFLKRRHFGRFDVKVDGAIATSVDTSGTESQQLGHTRVTFPDGPHRVEVVSSSPARVRLLGAVLERDVPGIVLDSFGVGALNTHAMTKGNPVLNRQMLRARDYDLIIFMTGANDTFTMPEVPAGMAMLIEQQREALPDTPILLMTPADRGKDESFERTILVAEQRREIARANGLALWDLWKAMGGRDSMSRLFKRGLAHFDGVHFNEPGGAYVADLFVHALLRQAAEYVRDSPEAGCTEPESRYYDEVL